MTKSELINEMKKSFNGAGLITIKQVSQFTGFGKNTTLKLLADVEACRLNRKYFYAVGDVAEAILKRRI